MKFTNVSTTRTCITSTEDTTSDLRVERFHKLFSAALEAMRTLSNAHHTRKKVDAVDELTWTSSGAFD